MVGRVRHRRGRDAQPGVQWLCPHSGAAYDHFTSASKASVRIAFAPRRRRFDPLLQPAGKPYNDGWVSMPAFTHGLLGEYIGRTASCHGLPEPVSPSGIPALFQDDSDSQSGIYAGELPATKNAVTFGRKAVVAPTAPRRSSTHEGRKGCCNPTVKRRSANPVFSQ